MVAMLSNIIMLAPMHFALKLRIIGNSIHIFPLEIWFQIKNVQSAIFI